MKALERGSGRRYVLPRRPQKDDEPGRSYGNMMWKHSCHVSVTSAPGSRVPLP